MAEREIWKRFLRKHWFVVLFGTYLVLVVFNRWVPSVFPEWSKPILTIFEGLEE